MTLIRFEGSSLAGRPPVCASCGKRHGAGYAHPGMIRCWGCKKEVPLPRGQRWGSNYCLSCELQLTGGPNPPSKKGGPGPRP